MPDPYAMSQFRTNLLAQGTSPVAQYPRNFGVGSYGTAYGETTPGTARREYALGITRHRPESQREIDPFKSAEQRGVMANRGIPPPTAAGYTIGDLYGRDQYKGGGPSPVPFFDTTPNTPAVAAMQRSAPGANEAMASTVSLRTAYPPLGGAAGGSLGITPIPQPTPGPGPQGSAYLPWDASMGVDRMSLFRRALMMGAY